MGDILEPEDKDRLQENLFVGPAKVRLYSTLNMVASVFTNVCYYS